MYEVACESQGSPFAGAPDHVIATLPDALGGDVATASVPDEYEGPCRLRYGNRSVVLRNFDQARAAASFALAPDKGGYTPVHVEPAPGSLVAFENWMDWAL